MLFRFNICFCRVMFSQLVVHKSVRSKWNSRHLLIPCWANLLKTGGRQSATDQTVANQVCLDMQLTTGNIHHIITRGLFMTETEKYSVVTLMSCNRPEHHLFICVQHQAACCASCASCASVRPPLMLLLNRNRFGKTFTTETFHDQSAN